MQLTRMDIKDLVSTTYIYAQRDLIFKELTIDSNVRGLDLSSRKYRLEGT